MCLLFFFFTKNLSQYILAGGGGGCKHLKNRLRNVSYASHITILFGSYSDFSEIITFCYKQHWQVTSYSSGFYTEHSGIVT